MNLQKEITEIIKQFEVSPLHAVYSHKPVYGVQSSFITLSKLFITLPQSLKQQDLSEAVKYISRSPDVVKTVRDSLIAQPSNVIIHCTSIV